jgi:hypothetical protein
MHAGFPVLSQTAKIRAKMEMALICSIWYYSYFQTSTGGHITYPSRITRRTEIDFPIRGLFMFPFVMVLAVTV